MCKTQCITSNTQNQSNYKTTSQLWVVTLKHFGDLAAGAAYWSSVPERLKVQMAAVNWEGNLKDC